MNHLTADQLIAYQLQQLTEEEMRLVEQHAATCATCEEELFLLLDLHHCWTTASPAVEPSDTFLTNTLHQLEPPPAEVVTIPKFGSSMFHRFVHLAIAGAAAFLFFQFQFTQHIVEYNGKMVQTIEQTSTFMEQPEQMLASLKRIHWRNDK